MASHAPDDRRRWNNPRTAPLVPVSSSVVTELVPEPPGLEFSDALRQITASDVKVTVRVRGWLRDTDEIVEYTVVADPPKAASVTRRPLNDDDHDWLRRIGARGAAVDQAVWSRVRERLLDISEGKASEVALEPHEAEMLIAAYFELPR